MTPLCLWTGKRDDRAIEIEVQGTDRLGRPGEIETLTVLPEHEAELRAYAARAQRYGSFLLFGILGLTSVSLLAAALGVTDVWSGTPMVWTIGACVGLMGALMVAVPLATPETLQAFGARRSIQIARVSGLVTLATGLAIALLS
ncbi:MAG: hypothetical protein Rubg2KO_01240 [Rubricoccaceae bacterium]